MGKARDINMLEGPLLKSVIIYTIPIILTNILQLFFNAADLIVVGRFCGSISVAAVGSTSSLIHLLINLFVGLSVGAGITTAQALGAKDSQKLEKIIRTTMPTALISGIFVTIVGFLGTEWFLSLMKTPADILPLSATYMKIYFLGSIANMVYNFCSAVLRAVGDTRSPLIYLTVSGLLNVVLNLIFVIFFDMDVAGVALATIISQYLSAFLVVRALIVRKDSCHLNLGKMRIFKNELLEFLKIGIPTGLQSSMFSISNVIIQSSINSLGAAAISGGAAGANIEGFVYMIMNAFTQTAINFTGQNVGIKNYRRVAKVLKICLLCVATAGLLFGSTAFIFSKQLLSIYITDSPQAITQGIIRMSMVCLPYFLCGIMDATGGALRGMGASLQPMLISIVGVCGFRFLWIFTLFKIPFFHTSVWLYTSYPISWSMTFIAELIAFIIIYKRRVKGLIKV